MVGVATNAFLPAATVRLDDAGMQTTLAFDPLLDILMAFRALELGRTDSQHMTFGALRCPFQMRMRRS